MVKNISINKDEIVAWFNDIGDYFTHLPQDEIIAWAAIGVGFILFLIGIILL